MLILFSGFGDIWSLSRFFGSLGGLPRASGQGHFGGLRRRRIRGHVILLGIDGYNRCGCSGFLMIDRDRRQGLKDQVVMM